MKINIQQLNKTDYIKLIIPLLYAVLFFLVRDNVWKTVFYFVGWYAGMALMYLDKNIVYKYYYESIHQKDDTFARLVTRSILFIIAYFVLSLFLVTSSGSPLGMGLIMGIGLVLAFELWSSKKFVEFFNHYFIQSKKTWNALEINNFVRVFLVFYVIMSIFSVI